MSITNYSDFTTSYLVKNGMVSNEANLNKSQIQLKTEIDILNNIKQENLVSGTNIKTINNNSILGSGNIALASDWNSITAKPTTLSGYGITDAYTKTQTDTAISTSITNLINAAPAALDTLGEIATQLANDESVVSALTNVVSNKVDKVVGKGLSTEDYTTAEKIKLADAAPSSHSHNTVDMFANTPGFMSVNDAIKLGGIAEGANKYILPVASATVLGGVKAGTNISIDANGVISANDTSVAWSEITSKPTTLSGYGITDSIQSALVSGTNIKTINGTSILGSGDITISGGATLSNDVLTDSSFYPVFTTSTSGNMSTASVSSTKLFFNPSTGTLNSIEFNAFSDERLKENVVTINDALTKVTQLRGVNYNNKDDKNKVLKMGVIAQEVQKIIPEVINDSEELLTVNYNSIIGLLIESIKELNNKVQFLQSVIDGKV